MAAGPLQIPESNDSVRRRNAVDHGVFRRQRRVRTTAKRKEGKTHLEPITSSISMAVLAVVLDFGKLSECRGPRPAAVSVTL